MLSAADVTGVFQVESSGFRELLKKLKPDCFEDIVAAGALYRPGPLEGGMVDDFIDRKHGRKKVEYDHPLLEPILRDTYGVIVYQEQVMQISSALAGYSLGRADLLRRAMGKKKAEVMAKEKAGFLEGAKEKSIDPAIAERVFDLMEKFAGYGFNRSHSAAYGLLTYQTAYLKRYFPVEFFAALLTCDRADTDAIVKFIAEARSQGIPVLRPDVNESDANFTVVRAEAAPRPRPTSGGPRRQGARAGGRKTASSEGKGIRFGLAAVKGVGEGAVEAIQAVRAAGRALRVADRLLPAGRRAQGEPQGARGAGQVGRLRRHRRAAGEEPGQDLRPSSARPWTGPRQVQRERESGQTSLLALLDGGAPGGGRPSRSTTATAARPTSGCRASGWPTRRRASAFTSAGTPSIASSASCGASPPPTPPTPWSGGRAPR